MTRSLIFVVLLFAAPLYAQEPLKSALEPCGTRGLSDWLRENRFRLPVEDRLEDTLWVALKPHLLAKDSGTGRISAEKFLQSFCQLNTDFAASGIQFYVKDGWDLLNETDWYIHADVPQGIDMMLTNNVPNALNTYFVADPAGNCGYNLPYGGVAIAHNCSGADDHTWSHEVGHALSLPHPFIGWEGKVYSSATPTPVYLTYDYTYFHDTLETQVPAPLDTALVENLNGSNCAVAADLICDSKPDYLSYRWDCDAQNLSTVKQKDPQGAEFFSDGTLYMSYALDHCQNRFTPEETAIMRATLLGEKANWLTPAMLEFPVMEQPVAIEPVQDAVVPALGAALRWSAVPHATHYLVQASRLLNFSFKQVDVVTTDTFLTAGQLTPNIKYYWRIRPFNNWHACAPFGELSTFRTAALSAVSEPDAEGWRVYPTQMEEGLPLTLEIPSSWQNLDARAMIFDATGRQIWQAGLQQLASPTVLSLPCGTWPAGAYRLILWSERGVKQGILLR